MRQSLSELGERIAQGSGILELMDDLGKALSGHLPVRAMMGGGNPARVPAAEAVWRRRMEEILADGDAFERMVGIYDTPQGQPAFIRAVAGFVRRRYGWEVTPDHIAVTNGSQHGFFCLFNLLAGAQSGGALRRILLPLAPEYIGYADQGLHPDHFRSLRPTLEILPDRQFKYHVDFSRLDLGPEVAAVCVSRPTNPTGNVLSDGEVARLMEATRAADIPLLIDNAYGAPFPHILFRDIEPDWDEHVVLGLSLSKLGLPTTRTGIFIGPPALMKALSGLNAVMSLANGNLGQTLVAPLLEDGSLERLSREAVAPFYRERSERARAWFLAAFADLPQVRMHVCEGAMFHWYWFEGLPITSRDLYERLKRRGVLVVPGEYFFYGLEEDWPHRHECIRVNYAMDSGTVREGIAVIAEEVARAYGAG